MLRSAISPSTPNGRLFSGSSVTFALNFGFKGLSFATSLVLARALGESGLGVYSFALATTMLLAIPAQLGINRLLVREVAAYHSTASWGLLAGLLRWAQRTTMAASAIVALMAGAVIWILRPQLDPAYVYPLLVALLLIPLGAIARNASQALVGLQHFIRGQWPELILQPLMFLALIGGTVILLDDRLDVSLTLALNAAALLAAAVVLVGLMRNSTPPEAKQTAPEFARRIWLNGSLSMMFIGAMNIVNSRTDILMLGVLSTKESVGVYQVANSAAELVLLVWMPVQVALAPIISSCFAAGQMAQLQKALTRSTRLIVLLSLPLAAGLLIFGSQFLSIFGQGFVSGHAPLSILVAGNLTSILFGPVTLLLLMTRHERIAAIAISACVLVNIVLNAVLIPIWGPSGAALATAVTKLLVSASLAVWILHELRLDTTIVGKLAGTVD